jgi:ferrochelatase
MAYDGVFLIAFGGPTPGGCGRLRPDGETCHGPEHGQACPEGCATEAHCFVQGILGKAPARAARVEAVAGHYHHIGGYSPFNELTFRQARTLARELRRRGSKLPVSVGMRHWGPSIADMLRTLAHNGHRSLIGIVMAPHQSRVSWDWYLQTVEQAIEALPAAERPKVSVLDPWWNHPGFTGAVADVVRSDVARAWNDEGRFREAELVFTAHSIPGAIAKTGPYSAQFEETGRLVAEALGKKNFSFAYQSSAADASQPWTGPDIGDALRAANARGVRDAIVSPVGFLVDHVEVLYDLDVEAKKTAAECGLGFVRSGTVGSHPRFIGMLADLVEARARR